MKKLVERGLDHYTVEPLDPVFTRMHLYFKQPETKSKGADWTDEQIEHANKAGIELQKQLQNKFAGQDEQYYLDVSSDPLRGTFHALKLRSEPVYITVIMKVKQAKELLQEFKKALDNNGVKQLSHEESLERVAGEARKAGVPVIGLTVEEQLDKHGKRIIH